MLAANAIRAGEGDLFVAGGMESMSRAPYLVDGRAGGLRYGHAQLTDALLHDGLWDPFENWGMGDAAEFIAEEFGVTRQAMDEYALQSREKLSRRSITGLLRKKLFQLSCRVKKAMPSFLTQTSRPGGIRPWKLLNKLRPAFQQDGRVTAGNAPGLSDGAAALVVSSRRWAETQGIKALACCRLHPGGSRAALSF